MQLTNMLAEIFISGNSGHIKQVENKDRVSKVEHRVARYPVFSPDCPVFWVRVQS